MWKKRGGKCESGLGDEQANCDRKCRAVETERVFGREEREKGRLNFSTAKQEGRQQQKRQRQKRQQHQQQEEAT